MAKKIFVVSTISKHLIKYAFYGEHCGDVDKLIADSNTTEMSQKWLGDNVTSCVEVTEDEYLAMFDRDNDYLQSWTPELKLKQINGEPDEKKTATTTASQSPFWALGAVYVPETKE